MRDFGIYDMPKLGQNFLKKAKQRTFFQKGKSKKKKWGAFVNECLDACHLVMRRNKKGFMVKRKRLKARDS